MNTQNLEHRFAKIYAKRAEHTYFAPNRVNQHTDYHGRQAFPCIMRLGAKLWLTKRENKPHKVSNVTTNHFLRANANAFENKQARWITYNLDFKVCRNNFLYNN